MDQCLIQRNDFLIVEFWHVTGDGRAKSMKLSSALLLIMPHQQAPTCEVSSVYVSKSGVSKLCPWAKLGQLPVFVNQVSLDHNHIHLFTFFLWLFSALQG